MEWPSYRCRSPLLCNSDCYPPEYFIIFLCMDMNDEVGVVVETSCGPLEAEFPLKSELVIGKKTVTVFKVVEEVERQYIAPPPRLPVGHIRMGGFTPGRDPEVHLHWWSGEDLKIKVLVGGEIDILR